MIAIVTYTVIDPSSSAAVEERLAGCLSTGSSTEMEVVDGAGNRHTFTLAPKGSQREDSGKVNYYVGGKAGKVVIQAIKSEPAEFVTTE